MGDKVKNEYVPDYVSPPGETLSEVLEMIGMSQAELARRAGRPKKTINEIIQGKTTITPETALQLERVLNIPASFWILREQHYRESLARREEGSQLADQVAWLKKVPIKAMIAKGWIRDFDDEIEQLREVLRFFGIASPSQWSTIWEQEHKPAPAFRQSPAFQANPMAVAAWLRKGELIAQDIDTEPYDEEAFRDILLKVRDLTVKPPEVFQPELVRLCRSTGVAVVFLPELPETRVSGVTRWLTSEKALIQLSFRYKTDDHLWFTFFHEAGHLLLHGKHDVFLEEDDVGNPKKEKEADQFAADMLIPLADWQRLRRLIPPNRHISKAAICAFASEIGIAPGIVVGRLQYEGRLPHSHCRDLKVTLAWDNN